MKWMVEGANLFFSLSVVIRSLVYLIIGLPCIIFPKFHFFVFILLSLSLNVDIIAEKSFDSLPF